MEKDIKAETINAKRKGVTVSFESKMQQAATMILAVHARTTNSVSWWRQAVGLAMTDCGLVWIAEKMAALIYCHAYGQILYYMISLQLKIKTKKEEVLVENMVTGLAVSWNWHIKIGKMQKNIPYSSMARNVKYRGFHARCNAEDNEMSSSCCLGISENTICSINDNRSNTLC